jgi:phosphate uptake regulator
MVRPRQEFDRELEAIEARVMKLFAMVAEDLRGATQALLRGNNEVLGKLAEREQAIEVRPAVTLALMRSRQAGNRADRHRCPA